MGKNLFALVDCNNFFVSCERAFRPDLETKPVAVLSSNDGCIVSRSNEVKKLGIPMGAPYFQYRELFKKNNVHVFSSNFGLYRDLSARVMSTVTGYTDAIEIYSIDEAFLHVPGNRAAVEWGNNLKKTIRQWTLIPTSIGIAPTKVLAKLASHIAKTTPEFGGVFDMSTGVIDDILACLPVHEVWGIGRVQTALLLKHGIETVLDLKQADDSWIRKHLTIRGLQIVHELRGTVCFPLFHNPAPAKSLIHSRSFGKTVENFSVLEKACIEFTTLAAEKLRSQHQTTRRLTIFIRTRRFGAGKKFHASTVVPLTTATNYTPTLIQATLVGLKNIYRSGFHYAKAGVCFTELESESLQQQNLFTAQDKDKEQRVMRAVDHLNERYGSKTIKPATLIGSTPWHVKHNLVSPRYTTVLNEIPHVH